MAWLALIPDALGLVSLVALLFPTAFFKKSGSVRNEKCRGRCQ